MSEQKAKYRLLKDLYVFHNPDVNKDVAYRLFTLDELKEIVSVSYPAGTIWEYDAKNGYMSNPDHGEIGIELTGPEPAWWEPYSEQDFPCGPNVAYEIFAPNGTPIVGTLELLKGVAGVTCVMKGEGSELELTYEGSTDIWWNDQKTKREAGERLYVDRDDLVWRESQLMLEPLPADAESFFVPALDSEGGSCD